MESLHPILCGSNKTVSDITVYLKDDGRTLVVYMGCGLLCETPCDPGNLLYKTLVGWLRLMGFKTSHLKEKLGHDNRTITAWSKALLSSDPGDAARIFAGRGGVGKLTGPLVRFVKMQYRLLKGRVAGFRREISSLVKEVFGHELSGETLRQIFRSADEEDKASKNKVGPQADLAGQDDSMSDGDNALEPCAGSPDAAAPETQSGGSADAPGISVSTCVPADILSLGTASARKWSPLSGVAMMPFSGAPLPRSRAVHHVGTALASSLLDHYFKGGRGLAGHGLRAQLVGQLLQGAVNIEQGHWLTAGDLGLFTGMVSPPGAPQRDLTGKAATAESTFAAYAQNLALLRDGPGDGDCFYLDPHSKEYTGQLKILKGWCGAKHGVAKILNLDAIHTASGRPCLIAHYDSYDDLRQRIFHTLNMFRGLFPDGGIFITLVVDRGIFGVAVFDKLAVERCRLVTWEKGYKGDGWRGDLPAIKFSVSRIRNSSNDLRLYSFECVEYPWTRRPAIRRIIVRATRPSGKTIEVSVLCSNPDMPVERAVKLIFNRWIQESDFLFLDRYLGINQLDSRSSLPYLAPEDKRGDGKTVVNPEYKRLKAELADAERQLGKTHRVIARLEKQAPPKPGQSANAAKKNAGLENAAASINAKIEQLEARLLSIDSKLPKEQHLADSGNVCLDTRRKAFLDAHRVVAANMIRILLEHFRKFHDNRRNDLGILRSLLRADGFVHFDGEVIRVELWLKGHYQPHVIKNIRRFLADISESLSRRFTDHPPMTISIAGESVKSSGVGSPAPPAESEDVYQIPPES